MAGTLIWSILDRKRANYRILSGWLRLWVRFSLAPVLFSYGFAKVFPLQFQPAQFARLEESFGQFSPMGVLWSFMGASIPYIILSGAAEVTGGLLLLFRRTATLGALVSAGVMANVVALNFCYDVPVKLFSSNLLAMAIFLAAQDARRLLNVLVLNRPAPPADLTAAQFEKRWARTAARAVWALFVAGLLVTNISSGWSQYQTTYVHPQKPPIGGAYEVESFRSGGKELPPLSTDAGQWRRVDFEQNYVMAQMMNQSIRGYRAGYPPGGRTVILNGTDTLNWSQPDATHLALEGKLNGNDVSIRLRKLELSSFPLNNRGFHWISEFPYNR